MLTRPFRFTRRSRKTCGPASQAATDSSPCREGGKSGTAYNFTDALFAGYNSRVTCAVWAGFDKPSPIYRGAFGSQVALPIWVKVMNAAREYMPGEDIRMPPGLKKVEICKESGELGTPKCFEIVDGERRRTTFITYATKAEMPHELCPVHTGGRTSAGALAYIHNMMQPEAPAASNGAQRATGAVDLSNIPPVVIKAPTVVGDSTQTDPYDTVQPVVAPNGGQPLATATDTGYGLTAKAAPRRHSRAGSPYRPAGAACPTRGNQLGADQD